MRLVRRLEPAVLNALFLTSASPATEPSSRLSRSVDRFSSAINVSEDPLTSNRCGLGRDCEH